MKIWMDGELIDEASSLVSVLSHTLHYGTGVFEGIRAYSAGDHAVVFRLIDHVLRLERSARAMGFPLNYSVSELCKAVTNVLSSNNLQDAYIRPLVFVGPGSLALDFHASTNELCVLVAARKWNGYFATDKLTGISIVTGVGRRLLGQAELNQAKVAGTYANAYVATMAAKAAGADEAILLDESGHIAEAPAANIFVVRDGELYTPTSRAALEGITRDTIAHLAGASGYKVIERDMVTEDLYEADEIFLTGTACEVVPVTKVDGRSVGIGNPGPLTKRLRTSYQQVVRDRDSFTTNIWIDNKSIAA